MIRTPLRPLARIIAARQAGENPDSIERENLRQRHEAARDTLRERAEGRLVVLGMMFLCGFVLIGGRMGLVATSDVSEPRAAVTQNSILNNRADIVDRQGRVLATNLTTNALYAQPPAMIDKARTAAELARIFPDLDEETLLNQFSGKRKFLWVKRRISPEQQQAVHDIGEPGLQFGPREMRLYPNGKLAAHILGGAGFGREGVSSAEVVGRAGVEKAFDERLRDPSGQGEPLQLSIDLTIQDAIERVLYGGMKLMNAKGASAVLMDIHSGEVVSMASLPDFDPNHRPRPLVAGDPGDSPLFNRAVQGVYELGSVFKVFTAAQALELGLINPTTIIDTSGPMKVSGFPIREFRNKDYGEVDITEILVNSSNRGTARLALMIGGERQKEFLGQLGFLEPTPIEMIEGPSGTPLFPKRWSEISTVTISYGHGISSSPLHLAAGYATIFNGGTKVTPTLLKQDTVVPGERVIEERHAIVLRDMVRQIVTRGTASFGEVEGYFVGGKTGTADKPKPRGGYYEDRVIATFASVFPTYDPKYVLIVTLDEPVETSGKEPRRTAGWTAVPVAAEIIRRTAPLLGVFPVIEPLPESAVTLVANE
ncbi:MAG: penicillin-binding protein 2 [Rhodobacteraceae bacterium]|nr:penicillin-binding protein 2 [Paracoccaceae bacterium]